MPPTTATSQELNQDVFLEIIRQDNFDLDSLYNLCKTNKLYHNYCKDYKKTIAVNFRKYKIDYLDPTNLIYIANMKKSQMIL